MQFTKNTPSLYLTEFGADAISSIQSDPTEVFSEEYQADMILSTFNCSTANLMWLGNISGTYAILKPPSRFHRRRGYQLTRVFLPGTAGPSWLRKNFGIWFQDNKPDR